MSCSSPKPEYIDPRVRRTREMLEHAMEQLLAARTFDKLSVGDIAEAATLNRATFYAHYTDKFDLLESLVASRFQNLLSRRGIAFDGTCPSALRGISLAVCDFLAGGPYCIEQRQVEQYMESAMVTIVRTMIVEGLRQRQPRGDTDPDMVAAAMAGAIYSIAKQWMRTPERPPAEEAAATISDLITPMLTSAW